MKKNEQLEKILRAQDIIRLMWASESDPQKAQVLAILNNAMTKCINDLALCNEEKEITHEDIIEFFRDDDKVNELNNYYRNEIALNCLAYNDDLFNIVEHAINLYTKETQ